MKNNIHPVFKNILKSIDQPVKESEKITPEQWAKWCAHKSNKERWIEQEEKLKEEEIAKLTHKYENNNK